MSDLIAALHAARAEERQQALYYRTLAAEAAARGDEAAVERLNELHADEQHHVSRISARLLELGESLREDLEVRGGAVDAEFDHWQAQARAREAAEVTRYESLVERADDTATKRVLAEILEVERHHLRDLGGKWTLA